MTDIGMYRRHTRCMWNIELGRVIQAEREQEIEADLKRRRLMRPTASTDTTRALTTKRRGLQRSTSTGAASR